MTALHLFNSPLDPNILNILIGKYAIFGRLFDSPRQPIGAKNMPLLLPVLIPEYRHILQVSHS